MRKVLWVAAAAAGATIAPAAWADGSPAVAPLTETVATRIAASVPILPILDPLAFSGRPLGSGNDPFGQASALRHRFASAMMDFYPVEGSGFHASFGTRFFKKQYIRLLF